MSNNAKPAVIARKLNVWAMATAIETVLAYFRQLSTSKDDLGLYGSRLGN